MVAPTLANRNYEGSEKGGTVELTLMLLTKHQINSTYRSWEMTDIQTSGKLNAR